MINILVGGDICPIGKNETYFKRSDTKKLFNELLIEFQECDLSIVNLECPLIDQANPISKAGPILGADSTCINGLHKANVDVVNLANNHIMDHGDTGIENTIEVCKNVGISTVGAGKNLDEARRILIKQVKDIKIGILGVAEHEFSIASENSWGANPLDIIDFVRYLQRQKKDFDYLIVLVHGGNEHYPYPSPRLRDMCRFMVEMGANAVIVQHTHCPGCYEEYQNALIVYGQGNFIFDLPDAVKTFYEGFLIKLAIDEIGDSKAKFIPFRQSNPDVGASKMDANLEKQFLNSLDKRSAAIKDDKFVMSQWLKYCERRRIEYLNKLFSPNDIFWKLNSKGRLFKYLWTKKSLVRFQNTISCEAHREVLETIFSNTIS